MDILYIGNKSVNGTSLQRANALVRLGHSMSIYDVREELKSVYFAGLVGAINYRTGFIFIQKMVQAFVKKILKANPKPDLIWVDHGELLGRGCVKLLKQAGCPVVLYINDDPTGGRDGRRFDSLLGALKFYDLCAVVREPNVNEFEHAGAKTVVRVFMSYDEIVHAPFKSLADIPDQLKSDVVFIGTWMKNEKRDEFMLTLIESGIPLSIWGNKWNRSKYWEQIKPFYRGPAIYNRDYIAALQGSKICLGLLSKGNRDLHTTRSFEIPYAGGLLCAERTTEHLALFEDGKEAVFWSNAEECVRVCKDLLANDEKREQIRQSGQNKVKKLPVGNQDVCSIILKVIDQDSTY